MKNAASSLLLVNRSMLALCSTVVASCIHREPVVVIAGVVASAAAGVAASVSYRLSPSGVVYSASRATAVAPPNIHSLALSLAGFLPCCPRACARSWPSQRGALTALCDPPSLVRALANTMHMRVPDIHMAQSLGLKDVLAKRLVSKPASPRLQASKATINITCRAKGLLGNCMCYNRS